MNKYGPKIFGGLNSFCWPSWEEILDTSDWLKLVPVGGNNFTWTCIYEFSSKNGFSRYTEPGESERFCHSWFSRSWNTVLFVTSEKYGALKVSIPVNGQAQLQLRGLTLRPEEHELEPQLARLVEYGVSACGWSLQYIVFFSTDTVSQTSFPWSLRCRQKWRKWGWIRTEQGWDFVCCEIHIMMPWKLGGGVNKLMLLFSKFTVCKWELMLLPMPSVPVNSLLSSILPKIFNIQRHCRNDHYQWLCAICWQDTYTCCICGRLNNFCGTGPLSLPYDTTLFQQECFWLVELKSALISDKLYRQKLTEK